MKTSFSVDGYFVLNFESYQRETPEIIGPFTRNEAESIVTKLRKEFKFATYIHLNNVNVLRNDPSEAFRTLKEALKTFINNPTRINTMTLKRAIRPFSKWWNKEVHSAVCPEGSEDKYGYRKCKHCSYNNENSGVYENPYNKKDNKWRFSNWKSLCVIKQTCTTMGNAATLDRAAFLLTAINLNNVFQAEAVMDEKEEKE